MGDATAKVEHLRTLRRLDEAEREARTALADDPEDVPLLCALAAVLLDGGHHHKGLAVAEAACAAAPASDYAHRLRAVLLSRLARHEEAEEAAELAVSLASSAPEAAITQASIQLQAGRTGHALSSAQRAASLDPQSTAAHHLLAHAHSRLGDRDAARDTYREVLRIDSGHAEARRDLALLELKAERYRPALSGLVDAGSLDPRLPGLLNAVTDILWSRAVQLMLGLVVVAIGSAFKYGWVVSGAALVVLTAMVWLSTRGLPRGTRTVVLTALRADRLLCVVWLVLTGCVALLVMIVATRRIELAALTVLIDVGLIFLALTGLTLRRVLKGRRARRSRGVCDE